MTSFLKCFQTQPDQTARFSSRATREAPFPLPLVFSIPVWQECATLLLLNVQSFSANPPPVCIEGGGPSAPREAPPAPMNQHLSLPQMHPFSFSFLFFVQRRRVLGSSVIVLPLRFLHFAYPLPVSCPMPTFFPPLAAILCHFVARPFPNLFERRFDNQFWTLSSSSSSFAFSVRPFSHHRFLSDASLCGVFGF